MIERGGKNEERLYIYDLNFRHGRDDVCVTKTDMPNLNDIIARHRARYFLPASFCRRDMKVLDFPCGSGYGYQILGELAAYEGLDIDDVSLEYARKIYFNSLKVFRKGNLCEPHITKNAYDIIACIEGIEHIESEFHKPLIDSFHAGLVPGGRLFVTCPESKKAVSGPSDKNPYHKHELTEKDFHSLLQSAFSNTVIFKTKDVLHNGSIQNMMYAICTKNDKGGS